MSTKKEYPATHSMWTAWFAIDKDGNVAIMECDDNGPAPIGESADISSEDLLTDSLEDEDKRIRYTDEQLLSLMKNSITSMEYMQTHDNYENIYESLCEIDPSKIGLLMEAASMSESSKIICVSKTLNLWYLYLSQPYYLYNSNRAAKTKKEKNKRAKSLYKKLFEDSVIKRIVGLYWTLGFDDEEDDRPGKIRHSDSPLNLYFQDYDYRNPSERMHLLPDDLQVHESQLPERVKNKAIRLPLSFKECDKIQLAQYIGVYFYDCNYDWEVDGMRAKVVHMSDGSSCFVGNGCYFEPIPLEMAFRSHKVRYTPYYPEREHEYVVNGKRGYLKYDENQYYLVGSNELFTPTEHDILNIFENDKD